MSVRVLFDQNLFKLIVTNALEIDELQKNYELVYNCTLTCKKWRTLIFQMLIPHFRKYNHDYDQFNFDNIMYISRLIKRSYFESDSHSHYKQPNIEHDDKFVLINPEHWANLAKNSKTFQFKQIYNMNKFSKIRPDKICKICSTISQTRTICGMYLYKLHLKKLEREKEELEKCKQPEEPPAAPAENEESSDEEIPDVEGVIPVDNRPDIYTDDDVDDPDESAGNEDDDVDQDEDDI